MTDVSDAKISARIVQKIPATIAAHAYSEMPANFQTGTKPSE